jgi:hypothetical protein
VRRLAVLLLVASVLMACSGDDGETTASTTGPPPATAPSGPVTVAVTPLEVELHDAGRAPRARLEHAFSPGSTSDATITLTLEVEGVTSAEVTGASSFTVEEVDAEGSASSTYALNGLDVAVSPVGGDPGDPVADALDVSGTLDVQVDRVVTAATVETSTSGAIPGVEAVAGSLDPRLIGLLLPFPTRPVGTGASWTVAGPLPLFGTTVDLTAELELIERDRDRFVLTAAIGMASAGSDTAATIDLQGIGRLEGDLRRLALRRGVAGLTGTIVLPDRGPDPLPMALELDVRAR